MGSQEREVAEHFAERYGASQPEVAAEIEDAVLGGRWGANGYTTREQADVLAREARIGPTSRVLDIGAGRGWPGLYLATSTGCEVVLVDVPMAALVAGRQRLESEGLSHRATAVGGSATMLPFGAAAFDAIVHTDVLCCLRPKLTVLRECLRLLRPGGRTAFYVIHLAEGLGPARRRRASRDGPTFVSSARPYTDMLAAVGFTEIWATDCTGTYATVASAWVEQRDKYRSELSASLGEGGFEERQADGRAKVRAIEDGILRRSLLTARRPVKG